jgi:hypothetical protein
MDMKFKFGSSLYCSTSAGLVVGHYDKDKLIPEVSFVSLSLPKLIDATIAFVEQNAAEDPVKFILETTKCLVDHIGTSIIGYIVDDNHIVYAVIFNQPKSPYVV